MQAASHGGAGRAPLPRCGGVEPVRRRWGEHAPLAAAQGQRLPFPGAVARRRPTGECALAPGAASLPSFSPYFTGSRVERSAGVLRSGGCRRRRNGATEP